MNEKAIYERYMYPGSEPRVPINLLGARNGEELSRFEAQIVAIRVKTIPPHAMELSYDGLKALHRHLFQDIYEWAGMERTYTTSRNPNAAFAKPAYIASWIEKQFEHLKSSNYYCGLEKRQFAENAASFFNEINAAHPFIEGNGRVQRLFLQMIAENAGYDLDLRAEDQREWYAAAEAGFLADNLNPLIALLEKRLTKLMTE